jgi:hypothetical protein
MSFRDIKEKFKDDPPPPLAYNNTTYSHLCKFPTDLQDILEVALASVGMSRRWDSPGFRPVFGLDGKGKFSTLSVLYFVRLIKGCFIFLTFFTAFVVVRLYDILLSDKEVVVSERPLKSDEVDILEETKDYVIYLIFVPTPPPTKSSETAASVMLEQSAAGGSSVLPSAHAGTGGPSSVKSPPAQGGTRGSKSALKGKQDEASAKSSPPLRTGSPADSSKKRPASDSVGGKSNRSKKGRFVGALKSKLLSPPAHQVATGGDDPDVTTWAPPQGTFALWIYPYVFFLFLLSHSAWCDCRSHSICYLGDSSGCSGS